MSDELFHPIAVPNNVPIPAVTAIAKMPQMTTRKQLLSLLDFPMTAAKNPKAASENRDVIETDIIKSFPCPENKTTIKGSIAPVANMTADAIAA